MPNNDENNLFTLLEKEILFNRECEGLSGCKGVAQYVGIHTEGENCPTYFCSLCYAVFFLIYKNRTVVFNCTVCKKDFAANMVRFERLEITNDPSSE